MKVSGRLVCGAWFKPHPRKMPVFWQYLLIVQCQEVIMPELFPCFTEKMKQIFMDIIASLGRLPLEQRGFLFGYEDEIDMEWVLLMAN